MRMLCIYMQAVPMLARIEHRIHGTSLTCRQCPSMTELVVPFELIAHAPLQQVSPPLGPHAPAVGSGLHP
jgi:hypothetical protein